TEVEGDPDRLARDLAEHNDLAELGVPDRVVLLRRIVDERVVEECVRNRGLIVAVNTDVPLDDALERSAVSICERGAAGQPVNSRVREPLKEGLFHPRGELSNELAERRLVEEVVRERLLLVLAHETCVDPVNRERGLPANKLEPLAVQD